MPLLGHSELVALFLGLGTLLASARLMAELARRCGQAAVLGEILAGILLGPTVLGWVAPGVQSFLFPPAGGAKLGLDAFSQVSVALFLLVAGMEVDLSTMLRQGRVATAVSFFGMAIPFVIGFVPAWFAPQHFGAESGGDHLAFALFFAIALSISALPVIAKTLMDLNLFRSDLGMVVIASAILQDLVGWILFAVVLGMIHGGSQHGPGIGGTIVWVLLFAASMLTVVRWLFHRLLPFVLAYASWPGGALGFILTLALFGGAFTEFIGVHAIFGTFMVGIAVGDTPHLRERTRAVLDQFISIFFAPLFFAGIGLRVDFFANFDPVLVVTVLVIACIGKIGGAGLGARLAGMERRQSWAIGFAMNSRGAMEIILGLLALQYQVIGNRLFVALVVMALVTSLMSGPVMQRILNRPRPRRFLDVLPARAFLPRLQAADRDEAIRELARALAPAAHLDAETIAGAALEREHAMATGLSNGLAVPHARLPGLTQPVAALGLSRAGVDFQSPDGKPAHVVLLLLTPEADPDAQLELLADLARTFSAGSLRELALRAQGYTEFRALLKTEKS